MIIILVFREGEIGRFLGFILVNYFNLIDRFLVNNKFSIKNRKKINGLIIVLFLL